MKPAARITLALAATTALGLHLVGIRPWMAQWGSSDAERQRLFPGADLVPPPVTEETRAITIRAPPPTVWRWLGQIGQGRGGFYSYDWLENLVGANIHNVYQLRDDLPSPTPGDTIRLAPDRYLGGRFIRMSALPVVDAEPGKWLVLRGWGTFVVDSLGPASSRLIVRERIPHLGVTATILRALIFDPMHFVMERQMLRGIRDLAEERSLPIVPRAIAFSGFAVSAVVLLGILARRRRWISIAATAAVFLAVLVSTGDWSSAFVGLVGVGLLRLAVTQLPLPSWVTVPSIVVLVSLVLLVAPDAYLVLGWFLGAGALATLMLGSFMADPEPNDIFTAPVH